MKRLLAPFLALLGLAVFATPASAYCIVNKTRIPLSVVLKTYSPLGDFREVVAPGHETCCDWFDRRCNPAASREAIVTLSIRQFERKVSVVDEHGHHRSGQYVPIETFDAFGNPDPHGHYDKWGNYDEHGFKPYFKKIETFDEHGNPNPMGHYDRYGVYDAHGHQGRHGELVIPQSKEPEIESSLPPRKAVERMCVRGKQPIVLASGAGTVSVSEDMLKPGGLRCESRDHFLRPISPPSQASEFGVPIKDLPMLKYSPDRRVLTTPRQ